MLTSTLEPSLLLSQQHPVARAWESHDISPDKRRKLMIFGLIGVISLIVIGPIYIAARILVPDHNFKWLDNEYRMGSTFPIPIHPKCVDDNPCKNNGQCTSSRIEDGYMCVCSNQYTGKNCENIKNICLDSNPCQNNGQCISLDDKLKYTCFCSAKYTGKKLSGY